MLSTSPIPVLSLASGSATNYGIAAGDCLWENSDVLKTFTSIGHAIISSIDTVAGKITMGGTADQSVPINRFDWWLRQPSSNEATR